MTSLLILMIVLLAVWGWGISGRGQTEFMQPWQHVPLLAAMMCLVMVLGIWIR